MEKENVIISGRRSRGGVVTLVLAIILAVIGVGLLMGFINSEADSDFMFMLYIGLALIGISTAEIVSFSSARKVSITVTNLRVYGTANFKKRVDLPIDNISAVGTSSMHGIAISSSSGVIKFKGIANNAEIHSAISKLLLERQSRQNTPSAPTQVIQQSDSADQLKKFKELLDSGVITQEEFDAKKKELLGL